MSDIGLTVGWSKDRFCGSSDRYHCNKIILYNTLYDLIIHIFN